MTDENQTQKVTKVINQLFDEDSGLKSLGQGMMDSWQLRRTVMEMRDRHKEATSRSGEEADKIYREFDRYRFSLPEEYWVEARIAWESPDDPWYNPGKNLGR